MPGKYCLSILAILFATLLVPMCLSAAVEPQTVSFANGKLTLHGVLYKPEGKGPFPAVLYNHGSAPGMLNQEAFDTLAPAFVNHGWIFFAPYRRGQGLSESAGPYIGDQIRLARKEWFRLVLPIFTGIFIVVALLVLVIARKMRTIVRVLCIALVAVVMGVGVYLSGMRAAGAEMVRVLETDQLSDQLAAYDWLRSQDFVQANHIAVAGNSFGGVETVLGAERVRYCAAIDAAGAAESWTSVPKLQARMIAAARNSQAPILFFQAENDYNLAPSRVLSEEMKNAGKPAELKIYPAFGRSAADGHNFSRLGASIWAGDVFRFLERYCTAHN